MAVKWITLEDGNGKQFKVREMDLPWWEKVYADQKALAEKKRSEGHTFVRADRYTLKIVKEEE